MLDPQHQLSQQICFSYYAVNRLFNRFYQQALEEFELTYPQYLVLVTLWEKSSLKLKELGEVVGLSSNTLTPLLKRLEYKNLILRLRPDKDKRQLILQLTEEGKALQTDLEERLMTCFRQLDGLTRENADAIIKQNQALIDSLETYLQNRSKD